MHKIQLWNSPDLLLLLQASRQRAAQLTMDSVAMKTSRSAEISSGDIHSGAILRPMTSKYNK